MLNKVTILSIKPFNPFNIIAKYCIILLQFQGIDMVFMPLFTSDKIKRKSLFDKCVKVLSQI